MSLCLSEDRCAGMQPTIDVFHSFLPVSPSFLQLSLASILPCFSLLWWWWWLFPGSLFPSFFLNVLTPPAVCVRCCPMDVCLGAVITKPPTVTKPDLFPRGARREFSESFLSSCQKMPDQAVGPIFMPAPQKEEKRLHGKKRMAFHETS